VGLAGLAAQGAAVTVAVKTKEAVFQELLTPEEEVAGLATPILEVITTHLAAAAAALSS